MPVAQPDGAIATIATGTFVDAIFSADSSRLYATSGNTLSVIDVATGAVLTQYTVGTKLGAIDVSVDGRYLAVVEQQAGTGIGTVYRIDLTTGEVTSYSTSLSGSFFDVSFLADGTVLLSQSGSGSTPLRVLDFSTGSFTAVGTTSFPSATLTASADANEVSVQPPGYTQPSYVYTTGAGITAQAVSVADPYAGASLPPPGEGVSAISPTGDLIIQAVSLNVYDGALNFQFSLRTMHPYLGGADGMAFSPDGQHLYVLLGGEQGQLIVLSTSTWEVVGGYRVGSAVPQAYDSISGAWRGYGNMVQVSADGNFVSVIGTNGVQLIDVSLVQYESTQGADDVAGTGLVLGFGGDDVLTATGPYSYARLLGGTGNDSYYISGYSHYADEFAGEGHDTVYSTVGAHARREFRGPGAARQRPDRRLWQRARQFHYRQRRRQRARRP